MNITTDLDGSFEVQQVGLVYKDFFRSEAELPNLGLGDLNSLPGSRTSDFQEAPNNIIQSIMFHPKSHTPTSTYWPAGENPQFLSELPTPKTLPSPGKNRNQTLITTLTTTAGIVDRV